MTEALDGKADVITDERRQRLRSMGLLAPGDFAAVKQQTEKLDDVFEPDGFLLGLDAEHRVESEVRQKRDIRFVKP